MHTLEIHLQSFKGTDQVGLGEEGSILVCHYLILNGEHIERPRESRDEDPSIHYSIVGESPTGFMFLAIKDPWPELKEKFSDEEILYTDYPALLQLPLRKVSLIPYEIPPPVTEEQYEAASLPFSDR